MSVDWAPYGSLITIGLGALGGIIRAVGQNADQGRKLDFQAGQIEEMLGEVRDHRRRQDAELLEVRLEVRTLEQHVNRQLAEHGRLLRALLGQTGYLPPGYGGEHPDSQS